MLGLYSNENDSRTAYAELPRPRQGLGEREETKTCLSPVHGGKPPGRVGEREKAKRSWRVLSRGGINLKKRGESRYHREISQSSKGGGTSKMKGWTFLSVGGTGLREHKSEIRKGGNKIGKKEGRLRDAGREGTTKKGGFLSNPHDFWAPRKESGRKNGETCD